MFLQHEGGPGVLRENVRKVLEEEFELKLYEADAWDNFAERVRAHRTSLVGALNKLRAEGRKIAVYGASGKGQSLLQFCGVDRQVVDFVVDKSGMKQGRFTPGTHIPIFPPAHIYEENPDVLLLCAWNFAAEIVKQEERFVSMGGKFLHPFPEPHYV